MRRTRTKILKHEFYSQNETLRIRIRRLLTRLLDFRQINQFTVTKIRTHALTMYYKTYKNT